MPSRKSPGQQAYPHIRLPKPSKHLLCCTSSNLFSPSSQSSIMNSILIGSNQTPKRPITSITPVRPIKIEYETRRQTGRPLVGAVYTNTLLLRGVRLGSAAGPVGTQPCVLPALRPLSLLARLSYTDIFIKRIMKIDA
jgi:hypothetical protein